MKLLRFFGDNHIEIAEGELTGGVIKVSETEAYRADAESIGFYISAPYYGFGKPKSGRKKVAAIPASHWRDIEVLDCIFCNHDFHMDINTFLINYEYDTKTDSYKKRVR